MTTDDLEAASHQALLHQEVRKAKTKSRTMSDDAKERQRVYNKKRNMRLKLLAEKADELGIEISEKEVQARITAS